MKQRKPNSIYYLLAGTVIFILSLPVYSNTYAQIANCQWGKSIGNATVNKNSVATDNFGNEYLCGFFSTPYIVLGSDTLFNNGTGNKDFYLAKYNHLGYLVWARSGGSNQNEFPMGVTTDSTGNIYLFGYYTSTSFVLGHDTLTQSGNTFLIKYDPGGNILWARSSVGESYPSSIATYKDGTSYVTGIYWNTFIAFGNDTINNASRAPNLFVTKYTTDGIVEWVRGNQTLNQNTAILSGDIKTDNNGSIYLAGSFGGQFMVFGSDTVRNQPIFTYNSFLLKMDTSGNFIWVNGLGYFSTIPTPVLCLDATSNSFLTFNSTAWELVNVTDSISGNNQDAVLVKYNTDGIRQWAKKSSLNTIAIPFGAAFDHGGNVYITGNFFTNNLTFATDTLIANDSQALFLIKYDNDGNQVWAKGGDSCNVDQATAIAIDPIDNIYLSGYFIDNTLKLDAVLMNPTDLLSPHGFLAKYSVARAGIQTNNPDVSVVIYPNPTSFSNEITVRFPGQTFTKMDIYNYLGQRVYETTIGLSETNQNIPANRLAPGQYFIRLYGNNNTKTLPLITLP